MKDVLLLDNKPVTVGSSDVASILGVSRWGSPWSTWMRLVGLVPRYDVSDTGDQHRGRMFEPAIGQRWAWEHAHEMSANWWLIAPGPAIPNPSIEGPLPWMSCRPDFTVGVPARPVEVIVEAKSCRYFDAEDGWTPESAPIGYAAQGTWQNAVIRPVQGCTIAAFATIQEEYREYPLPRNERLERRLVARVWDFYEAYVLTGTPPPIDGSEACGKALYLRNPQVKREMRDATDIDRALVRDLWRVRNELAALETKRTHLENTLKASIGEHRGIDGLVTWTDQKGRTTLNMPNDVLHTYVPQQYIDQFIVKGEPTRVFRLKPEKE